MLASREPEGLKVLGSGKLPLRFDLSRLVHGEPHREKRAGKTTISLVITLLLTFDGCDICG
jgi:hypothetical protein